MVRCYTGSDNLTIVDNLMTHSHMIRSSFVFVLIVTTLLWILAKPVVSIIWTNPIISIGQITALLGIVALSFNFFLASRFIALDALMGGLDKVFIFHRFTGKLAFILMLIHPLFVLASFLPNWQLISLHLYPNTSFLAESFGVIALWLFFILISLTLFVKMPYHIWKLTHKFMGVPFILIALHVATIQSDVAVFLPLRIWMFSLIFAGIGLYIYKVFLYRYFGPKFSYTIETVTQKGEIVEIELRPNARTMSFRPGQFVFLSVNDVKVGKEEHPFSISSSPDESVLRLSMKQSGDYTNRLNRLKSGTTVSVYGPYGRFGERFLERAEDAIWIAGGIGVTPFLSLAQYASSHKTKGKIDVFYSTKTQEEMVYQQELETIAEKFGHMSFHPHVSSESGYLDVKKIQQAIGDISKKRIFLCGPPIMMKTLTDAFVGAGVPRRNIIFEDFSLR